MGGWNDKVGEGGTRSVGLMEGLKRAPLLFELCTSAVLIVFKWTTLFPVVCFPVLSCFNRFVIAVHRRCGVLCNQLSCKGYWMYI